MPISHKDYRRKILPSVKPTIPVKWLCVELLVFKDSYAKRFTPYGIIKIDQGRHLVKKKEI